MLETPWQAPCGRTGIRFWCSPAVLFCINSAAGDNDMYVRMVIQSARLSVQHGGESDVTFQVPVLFCKIPTGTDGRIEQQRIQALLVMPGNAAALCRQSKGHHEIVHRQQFGLLALKPTTVVVMLAAMATAVSAGAVFHVGIVAGSTL